ncbi:hypothetical protein NHX12_021948 [Muraenolepis orangiensis]|uniref:Uncharacterized protein n=1 Tax=Muraenolepis orangiensis TaxID=630683 RepID=A0A9Q0EMI5_9TELE|nr:hypothetical protein NHX12_021948 [Muraenolepis orangiensis]
MGDCDERLSSQAVCSMASPLHDDLSFAWEKYMDCRLQGADLQVSLQCLENFLCLFHCVRKVHLHVTKDLLTFW